MTTEPDEKDNTAPIELPHPPAQAAASSSPGSAGTDAARPLHLDDAESTSRHETLETPTGSPSATEGAARPGLIPRAATAAQQEVMFVPLAVSVGDGFKFGCGFFLAMVLALLVAFVLLALLFVLTSLFGLNLPISR